MWLGSVTALEGVHEDVERGVTQTESPQASLEAAAGVQDQEAERQKGKQKTHNQGEHRERQVFPAEVVDGGIVVQKASVVLFPTCVDSSGRHQEVEADTEDLDARKEDESGESVDQGRLDVEFLVVELDEAFERRPSPDKEPTFPVVQSDEKVSHEHQRKGVKRHQEIQGGHVKDVHLGMKTEMRIEVSKEV